MVSNEQSANEPTLVYYGVAINHQHSKSQEFERGYQALLQHSFGDSLRYYSLLRPLSELRIAELFAPHFDTYRDVFSSCNTAFRHGNVFTPFVDRRRLEALFSGKNLLLDPALRTTYKQLLGIEGDKPLDCVGEVRESRVAMQLAQEQYPELGMYEFELDEMYNFRAVMSHEIPGEIWEIIGAMLQP